MNLDLIEYTSFAAGVRQAMLEHCRRKLAGEYLPGEEEMPKAFGIIGGRVSGNKVVAERVVELKKNIRNQSPFREKMDRMMEKYAIASETPIRGRGWVADPGELRRAVIDLKNKGLTLIGTYHMHRVAWADDPVRDTPTLLDTILGRESRLLMFIVSMVEPEAPRIRVFKEGEATREVKWED